VVRLVLECRGWGKILGLRIYGARCTALYGERYKMKGGDFLFLNEKKERETSLPLLLPLLLFWGLGEKEGKRKGKEKKGGRGGRERGRREGGRERGREREQNVSFIESSGCQTSRLDRILFPTLSNGQHRHNHLDQSFLAPDSGGSGKGDWSCLVLFVVLFCTL
jgi:hypothetical protein